MRCICIPEGKLNELTGELRAGSKNEDAGIIQWLLAQGVTKGNTAIFYARGRQAAKLTAQKIARECDTANPIGGSTWLVGGKTTFAALSGRIPDLRDMAPTIQFVIFVGTKEFLVQIAEEHSLPTIHVQQGDFVIELDTGTETAREIQIQAINDDAHKNGGEEPKDAP